MNIQLLFSAGCFLLVMLTGLVFAYLYLFRHSFMPYHSAAVGMQWGELEPATRVLIIALMRVIGGGWLAVSSAIGWMVYIPMLNGERWSSWAILFIGLSVTIPTFIATLIIKKKTRGKPPVFVAFASIVMLMLGFFVSIL